MVGNYRSQGSDEANGQLKAKVLESGQIFLFSHGQDPERTSLRPDIHKCLWLTMHVFLVVFEIQMLGFLERLFQSFYETRC